MLTEMRKARLTSAQSPPQSTNCSGRHRAPAVLHSDSKSAYILSG